MNLEMEKNVNFSNIEIFFLKNHWIWTTKMDFHLPFLGECNVHLPTRIPTNLISSDQITKYNANMQSCTQVF
jgi:hypothetical protein